MRVHVAACHVCTVAQFLFSTAQLTSIGQQQEAAGVVLLVILLLYQVYGKASGQYSRLLSTLLLYCSATDQVLRGWQLFLSVQLRLLAVA